MGIKVEHQGNAASRIAGMSEGGRAKRAMESAQLVRPSQIQTLTPAHASAPGAGAPSAPTISAPGGGAHAGLIGGAGGVGQVMRGVGRGLRSGDLASNGSRRFSSGSQGDGDADFKITGYERFNRPDDESVWDDSSWQWKRRWRPGEKEAEALEYKLSAKQRVELNGINNAIEDARASGRYNDAEMAELERQAFERRIGIKPLPMMKEESAQSKIDKRLVNVGGTQGYLDSKGDFQPIQSNVASDVYAGTHVDQDGRRWGLDKSGKLYEVGGSDDFAAMLKLVPESVEEVVMEKGIDGVEKPVRMPRALSVDERLDYVRKIMELKREMSSGGTRSPGVQDMSVDPAIAARAASPLLGGAPSLVDLKMPDPSFASVQEQTPAPAPAPAPVPAPVQTAQTSVSTNANPLAAFSKYKRK